MCLLLGCRGAGFQPSLIQPEQTQMLVRPPETGIVEPPTPAPQTVSHEFADRPEFRISLNEAIRIALENSTVVRVLVGTNVTTSGRTIYDTGITNTTIDQSRGRFDPVLSVDNTFNRNETPSSQFDFLPPFASITGTATDSSLFDASVSKVNPLGGVSRMTVGAIRSDISPSNLLPLNPQTTSFTELSYVQPLLQGGGIVANGAPIVIASLETERSFFQFKGSVQELTRSVSEAFWLLVAARTDRWAREQQVQQAEFAYSRELARKNRGLGDLANVAQSRVTLANFRSNLIASKSQVILREGALLNLLGMRPTEVGEVIPTTPPYLQRLEFNWTELINTAESCRPDLVELKLILEADLQRVIVAQNNALPRLDGMASYRWDGLNGTTPSGTSISSQAGEFTDWNLGINFSVPLGLRQGRAAVRQQELIVSRDRANLQQGVHNAVHQVARSLRNLDQYYEQYEASKETREAGRDNLLVQHAEFANGRSTFLNVLLAIVDWGNAIGSEAQALCQYNAELANLELQTGTILEAHGIRFLEERHRFAGPWGKSKEVCYPSAFVPTDNVPRYPEGDSPSEDTFNLVPPNRRSLSIPPPPQREIPGDQPLSIWPDEDDPPAEVAIPAVADPEWTLFIP